jgi:type IV pilus biogenesis protein CpaD/CtpE
MRMKKYLVQGMMILLALCLVAGCAAQRKYYTKCLKGEETPNWVHEIGKQNTKKLKAFCGVSKQYSMEQQARSDARLDAYKQAIDDMGVYGKRKLHEVVSSAGVSTDIIDPAVVSDEMTKLKAIGVAIGRVKEYHVQFWEKVDEGGVRNYYVVYCLYLVPRDAVKKYMESVLKRQAALAKEERDRENINRALEKLKEFEAEDW